MPGSSWTSSGTLVEPGELSGTLEGLYCRVRYILAAVTKRLIDIDDELLRAAQATLGAGTFKETVRAALEQVIARRGRAGTPTSSLLAGFAAATRDLSDPEVMDAAWR